MINILVSLLGAWVLSLFGLKSLFIDGMLELFGIAITGAGYYFIFALIGVVRSVLRKGIIGIIIENW